MSTPGSPSRHLPVAAAALVVGAAVSVLVAINPGPNDEDPPASGDVPFRVADRPAPVTAVEKLRRLRDLPAAKGPRFSTIEGWARRLSDEELLGMTAYATLDDVGLAGHWLRCAVVAEWGRRDPAAAQEFLMALHATEARASEALGALWFSVFRGWADVDPETAFDRLEELRLAANRGEPEVAMNGRAMGEARTYAFRILAEQDPDGAWQRLAVRPDGAFDAAALRGFWASADTAADLVGMIEDWEQLRKNASAPPPEALGLLLASDFENRFEGQAALALADLDYQRALRRHGEPRLSLVWARRHPQDAVGRIRSGNAEGLHLRYLVAGAVSGDPRSGPELVPLLRSESARAWVIRSAAYQLFRPTVAQIHPVPGQPGPPPDFPARKAALLETTDAAGLSPEVERQVRAKVEDYFRDH